MFTLMRFDFNYIIYGFDELTSVEQIHIRNIISIFPLAFPQSHTQLNNVSCHIIVLWLEHQCSHLLRRVCFFSCLCLPSRRPINLPNIHQLNTTEERRHKNIQFINKNPSNICTILMLSKRGHFFLSE